MGEAKTVADVRAQLSHGDVRLYRNNVGVLQDKTGKFVTFGLCVGSSDLIGYRSVTVTPDMVGQKVAIFAALEGKDERKMPTEVQRRFMVAVKEAGGIAGVFRSVDDAAALLGLPRMR